MNTVKVRNIIDKNGKYKTYGYRTLAEGVTVPNDTRMTGLSNNDCIVAPSGAGKSGGVVGMLLKDPTCSMVVTDCKGGRLEKLFGNHLRRCGYNVVKINFADPTERGEYNYGYNPLQFVRRNADGSLREQDIITITKTICGKNKDEKEPVWDLCCQDLVTFYIAYVLQTETPARQNLKTVAEVHDAFNQPDGEVQFLHWANQPENRNTYAARKLRNIMCNMRAEKMYASILGFVNVTLAPYSFKEAENIFAAPVDRCFDINKLGTEKTVLFLDVCDTDSSFDGLVNTFYNQALHVLCIQADANESGRLDVSVRLVFDDFISTPLPDFAKVISTIRSRDISCTILLQAISQLKAIYGEEAKTILGNCDHMLFCGASSDMETAEFVANRAFTTPEVVMSLPNEKAILITRGQKAEIVNKIVPYSMLGQLSC